ncbi:DUF6585 family protein [Streptomyces noursei]|uniref:DUF6585 family protein n=1 Tax=Streptomyces noursei TaxID=1971 RepID=UPI0033D531AB
MTSLPHGGPYAADSGIPSAIRRAADREGLGGHRRTYLPVRPNLRRHRTEGIATAVSCVLAVFGFTAGMPVLGILGATWTLIAGGHLLLITLRLGRVTARNRGTRLDLYDHGLVVSYRRRTRVARYDTTSIRQKVVHLVAHPAPDQITYTYRFVDTTGVEVILRHGMERPEEWGEEIQRAVTAAQLPRAEAALDAGERVDFTYLWLSAAEIGTRRRSVPWSRVAEVRVRSGMVSIHATGSSRPLETLPISLIPNYRVFRTLAERLHQAHSPLDG